MTGYVELAAVELKKNGKFKLGGVLNMKLKKKAVGPARKGVNPFTKGALCLQGQASEHDRACLASGEFNKMVN